MEYVRSIRRLLRHVQVNNRSEFISKTLDLWAYEHGITLDFARPGNPTDKPYVESFNGSLKDECPNLNKFLSLDDALKKSEAWRLDYNDYRPHQALADKAPKEFAEQNLKADFL